MSDLYHPASYVTLWEFHVRPGLQPEFERIYGSHGDWVQLFRTAKGYMRTELYRDLHNPHRYITMDFWESESAYRHFREQHADEYRAIDQRCEELTEKERALGSFQMLRSDLETRGLKPET